MLKSIFIKEIFMRILHRTLIFFLLLGLVFTVSIMALGQTESTGDTQEAGITVFTSILPQSYFVEQIGGNRVNVEVLVGPGKSPATYEPSPQQVQQLSSAAILFTIGVPFENGFLPTIRATLKDLEIVDTSTGIKKRQIDGHRHEDDHHDEEDHEHEAGALDPHIWLSPRLAQIQAKSIYDALVRLDPAGENQYSQGYEALIRDLKELDSELTAALEPYRGSIILVYHPAFGYFADDYGLTQIAIETGGKEPSPAQLEKIINEAVEEGVKIIFVQPEFSIESANAIAAAINGTVVTLAPLNPDYIENLGKISSEVKRALDN